MKAFLKFLVVILTGSLVNWTLLTPPLAGLAGLLRSGSSTSAPIIIWSVIQVVIVFFAALHFYRCLAGRIDVISVITVNRMLWYWLGLLGVWILVCALEIVSPSDLSPKVLLWLCVLLLLWTVKSKRRVILPVILLLATLFFTESYFLVRECTIPLKGVKKYSWSTKFIHMDPDLGYWGRPNSDSVCTLKVNDELAWSARYTTDAKGRRRCAKTTGEPRYHALFFGGSYTFGDGVEDHETLPSQFQERSESLFKSYNYAGGGWGTGQMLVQLGLDEFSDDITLEQGIAVYTFISDHTSRTSGKIRYLLINEGYPLFRLDEAGDLVGPIYVSRNADLKARLTLFRLLREGSPIGRYIISGDKLKMVSDRDAVEITVKVIERSKEIYDKRFNGDFYVLIWPDRRLPAGLEAYFEKRLKAGGIRVVRVPEHPDRSKIHVSDLDRHPSPVMYRWAAEKLFDEVMEGGGFPR